MTTAKNKNLDGQPDPQEATESPQNDTNGADLLDPESCLDDDIAIEKARLEIVKRQELALIEMHKLLDGSRKDEELPVK